MKRACFIGAIVAGAMFCCALNEARGAEPGSTAGAAAGATSGAAAGATAGAAKETPSPTNSSPTPPPKSDAAPLQPTGFTGASSGGRRAPGMDDFLPVPDRWRIGVPPGYIRNMERGSFLDPYHQNILKGDYPIFGQDIFLNFSAISDTVFEARKLPVPSGVSTFKPDRLDFFGAGEQSFITQNLILSFELFEGDTAFKPRDWEIRLTPVINFNYLFTHETGLVNPDVTNGRDRFDSWVGFQEAFVEKHLGDLSTKYDFWAVRLGIQGFNSDFRGFMFADNQPGVRLFGTADNNRLQWNLAYFYTLDKDTNSGLNSYSTRNQHVAIANLYRQDFLFPGYTAQLSFHANIDNGVGQGTELDDNGIIVRPAPIGVVQEKDVRAYYIGWAGDGHIGRVNISHQFYQAWGEESFNNIAGRQTHINAQFAALELSYDQDWLRYRASIAYASGDHDPFDSKAGGFDSIFDNPNFAGGGTSLFTRQAIRLTGSGVNLVNRQSFLPDLRTSKDQGQANFVNPGLLLYNLGIDAELTPKLRVTTNVSYLQFADTSVIKEVLHDDKIGRDIGIDCSIGIQYRPWLSNNVILNAGAAALVPARGFKDIYSSDTLYSVFMGITLAY